MRKILALMALTLLAACASTTPLPRPTPPESNAALRELKAQDQAARASGLLAKDPVAVYRQDEARRADVKEMLRMGRLTTAEDFFNAGLIFQHGDSVDDFRLAHSFANMALALDPGSREARWLRAASLDRMLLQLGKRQWFGTQQGVPVEDSYISDADRVAMGLSPLKK